jgi:hypothetical protein
LLHFEKPKLQEVFLSKTPQLSKGNNVLDAPPSNTDGFLLTDTYVSSIQLKRPIWNKISLSKLFKYLKLAGSIPLKN